PAGPRLAPDAAVSGAIRRQNVQRVHARRLAQVGRKTEEVQQTLLHRSIEIEPKRAPVIEETVCGEAEAGRVRLRQLRCTRLEAGARIAQQTGYATDICRVSVAADLPHGERERQSGPAPPCRAEIVDLTLRARRTAECNVADTQRGRCAIRDGISDASLIVPVVVR